MASEHARVRLQEWLSRKLFQASCYCVAAIGVSAFLAGSCIGLDGCDPWAVDLYFRFMTACAVGIPVTFAASMYLTAHVPTNGGADGE